MVPITRWGIDPRDTKSLDYSSYGTNWGDRDSGSEPKGGI